MGETYRAWDAGYFSVAPDDLKYAQTGAEGMGLRNAIFRLGDASPEAPVVVMLYMPPEAVLPRHAHACHRMEVVVQGSMLTEDGLWLTPGDVRLSAPGEFYGPHTAGPAGVLSVEIFSAGSGVDAAFPSDLPAAHAALLEKARGHVLAQQARPKEPGATA